VERGLTESHYERRRAENWRERTERKTDMSGEGQRSGERTERKTYMYMGGEGQRIREKKERKT